MGVLDIVIQQLDNYIEYGQEVFPQNDLGSVLGDHLSGEYGEWQDAPVTMGLSYVCTKMICY